MANDSETAKHVLIVEDEPDFAALLGTILAGAGYSTATAYNCEDALAQVRRRRPNLITLDIQMHRKSGVFFYRKLKAQEKFRDIPVVVVTGITHDDEYMHTLVRTLLEPDDVPHPEAYLEKPVDGPSLLKTVEAALSAGKSASG
jgi:CheY-like chemotaxis protein